MLAKLVDYLHYPFVQYALVVGILIALCASLLGITLVLKRFSFIGDGLSHVAFGAMAIAAVLKMTNDMPLMLAVTILSAILLLRTGQNAKIKGDAAVAMISVGALALGYLMLNLFAKTSKALERLNEMLRKGEIHKTYWALTANRPPKDTDILTDNLVRNEAQNKSYVAKNGKEARLKYTLIQTTERYFLLEVELYTGRHHQIRCQLSHMGCPIKGDLKYGAKRSNPDGGISLLARHIQFIHPVKKTEVDVTAPVPVSWKGIEG